MVRGCVLIAMTLALLIGAGCKNACEELADQLCDRAGDDLQECSTPGEGEAAADCQRMQAVVVSCKGLQEKAGEADFEDRAACESNLDLIKALDRQQM